MTTDCPYTVVDRRGNPVAPESLGSWFASVQDWNDVLEKAIEDFERGLIDGAELIDLANGRLVRR